jgi:hypothetical protein
MQSTKDAEEFRQPISDEEFFRQLMQLFLFFANLGKKCAKATADSSSQSK